MQMNVKPGSMGRVSCVFCFANCAQPCGVGLKVHEPCNRQSISRVLKHHKAQRQEDEKTYAQSSDGINPAAPLDNLNLMKFA
jgi:hypothetical protein